MVLHGVAIGIALIGAQQPQTDSAVAIMRRATAAFEGDSAPQVTARWTRRLERDSTDRTSRFGLALLRQLAVQGDTAAERAYRSLMPSPGQPADDIAGYAAIQVARMHSGRGQWVPADTIAAAAVAIGRQLGNAALEGEALAIQGLTRLRTRGAAGAYATFDSADAALPATALRARALSRCARAQALSFAGDAHATAAAQAGLELAQQSGDFRMRATCRQVIAGDVARRGNLDSASVVYLKLVADYRAARDHAGLAVALQWRSHIYRQIGWIARSRRDAEEAIVEANASGMLGTIPWARSILAWASLQLGDLAGAAPQAQEATRLFLAQGDRYSAVVARSLEGSVAFANRDLDSARAAMIDALARAQALRWAEAEVHAHRGLMHLAIQEGDVAAASRHSAAALARARGAGMWGFVQSHSYYEGVIALRARRYAEAERWFRSRRGTELRAQPQWAYLNAARLAEALAAQGKIAEATSELEFASTALDDWRRDLHDRQLRVYALQLSEDPADPDLGIATVISAITRANEGGAAFNLIERIRGRDLADRLTRAAASAADSTDRVVRSLPPVTVSALTDALDDSTAVVRYVTGRGGEPTTAFAITWRDMTWFRMAAEDSLGPVIARFTGLIESGDDAGALAMQLGKGLVQPIVAGLSPSIRRLILVPDGALHRVPFDALKLADGRYVIERFSISYAPSATVAAAMLGPRHEAPPATLVLADPRFANERDAPAMGVEVFRSAVAGRGALPRLPGSAREARAVARYSAAATVRRRDGASEAWLKTSPLTGFGVVHFATHALVDEESVTSTALALAPSEGEDGFVNAGELLGLKLAADLVVLSACRTAGGKIVRGEGVQGLAAPLLVAGTRAVAATWWPIGDEASVRLVDDFYRGLASGHPAGDALRDAKLAALARGAPVREWAAFTIIGDAMVKPTLTMPGRGLPVALLATVVAGALLLLYGVVTRSRRIVDAR